LFSVVGVKYMGISSQFDRWDDQFVKWMPSKGFMTHAHQFVQVYCVIFIYLVLYTIFQYHLCKQQKP